MSQLPSRVIKSTLTCDILAARHLPAADLAKEQGLMQSCWWEYRGIHPARRTELYAATYRKLYQRYTAKYVDVAKSEMVSGFAGREDIFADLDDSAGVKLAASRRRNLLGFWRGRQAADELTISYPIYISSNFEYASMKGFKYLPRPTHLYSDRAKTVALDEQINELERYIPEFKNRTLLAGSPAPHKADFDEWLYELGKLKRLNKDLAFRRMAQLGYICPETAIEWTRRARE